MHCRVVKRLLSILRIGHREQVEGGRERGRMSYFAHVFCEIFGEALFVSNFLKFKLL